MTSSPVSVLAVVTRGFTLLELLTTLIIILVLVGILIPTVKKMREKAQEASVKAQISSLDSAINRYQQDFSAFPGPLPRQLLYPTVDRHAVQPTTSPATTPLAEHHRRRKTSCSACSAGSQPRHGPAASHFDKSLIGRGPRSLNPANPKAYTAYIDGVLPVGRELPGRRRRGERLADPGNPRPLHQPAADPLPPRPGRRAAAWSRSKAHDSANSRVVSVPAGTPDAVRPPRDPRLHGDHRRQRQHRRRQDDQRERLQERHATPSPATRCRTALQTVTRPRRWTRATRRTTRTRTTRSRTSSNPSIPPTDTTTRRRQNATGTPRNKDRYILISAGVDRVYGTADDITNAGEAWWNNDAPRSPHDLSRDRRSTPRRLHADRDPHRVVIIVACVMAIALPMLSARARRAQDAGGGGPGGDRDRAGGVQGGLRRLPAPDGRDNTGFAMLGKAMFSPGAESAASCPR